MLASGNDAQAAQGTATASIGTAIGVSALTDLAFGTIVPGAGGAVIIDPDKADNQSRSSSGAVVLVSSTCHPAIFSVIGDVHSNKTYQVKISQTTKITNPQGSTMTVTLSTSSNLDRDKKGQFTNHNDSFKVGGTLAVAQNQAAGVYKGTFDVTVNY